MSAVLIPGEGGLERNWHVQSLVWQNVVWRKVGTMNPWKTVVQNFYTVQTPGVVPGTSSAEVLYFYNSATCLLCHSPAKQASTWKHDVLKNFFYSNASLRSQGSGTVQSLVLKYRGKMWYNLVVPRFAVPIFASAKPPCVAFRRVVVSLRGPGRSPVLPFACCVGSLHSVGRCGWCSCWCRFRVRRAQWLVCWGCAGCGGMCRLGVSGAQ